MLREKPTVLLGRPQARLRELRSEFDVAREARANVTHLPVDLGGQIAILYLDLELFGFLNEELLVDQLIDEVERKLVVLRLRRRRLESGLLAHRQHSLFDVELRDRLIADDRDDAIEGDDARITRRSRRNGRPCGRSGRRWRRWLLRGRYCRRNRDHQKLLHAVHTRLREAEVRYGFFVFLRPVVSRK